MIGTFIIRVAGRESRVVAETREDRKGLQRCDEVTATMHLHSTPSTWREEERETEREEEREAEREREREGGRLV